jgi:hypothetical protein
VTEIASCEILGQFLKTMRDDDFQTMRQKVLDTLSGLINAPRLVKEAHSKGNDILAILPFFLKMPNIIFSVMQKPFIKCVIRQRVGRFLHSKKTY